MNILLILAVVFGVLVLIRLANVAQLASELSGESEEAEQDRDNKLNARLMAGFLWLGLILLVYMIFHYKQYMLPVSASEHGVGIDQLMDLNWIILFIVFFITQILLFTFAFKYRYNKNRRSYFYHDNDKLEVIWTVIPAVVLIALVFAGLKQWNNITQVQHTDAMYVQVYGKQFDWTARYSGADNKLGKSSFRKITDNNPLGVDSTDAASADDHIARELHMPVNMPIDVVINSRDVIHSFYLPHFRVQMNAVPGMNTHFYFKPTITTAQMRVITKNPKFDYVLLCNKICGVAHYNMQMKVVVDSPADFKTWLQKEKLVFEKAVADTITVPEVTGNENMQPKTVALK